MTAFKRLYRGYGLLLRGCGVDLGGRHVPDDGLVVANIFGRYLFNAPVTGTLEFTESLLVLIIFLSLALTQYDGGHIRVTLLTRRLPRSLGPRVERVLHARRRRLFCLVRLCGMALRRPVLFVQ